MSCPHPPAAQYVDRARGTVTCTICGEVVNDQHLELDPAFARASDAISKPANAMRQLGVPRPTKMTGHVLPTSHRPSVEVARRAIKSISRTLHISDELVDKATGLYKIAVNANVVAGARTSVLCACLYAICRREGTSHMLYDFADATKECPYKILRDMKSICHATHTVVPVMDLSVLVIRLAEELDLGDKHRDVCIATMKLVRSMERDWISYGRRPLGVIAAALIVGCSLFGISRTADQLSNFIRLTPSTVLTRLTEFLATPTANLATVDDMPTSSSPSSGAAAAPGTTTMIMPTQTTTTSSNALPSLIGGDALLRTQQQVGATSTQQGTPQQQEGEKDDTLTVPPSFRKPLRRYADLTSQQQNYDAHWTGVHHDSSNNNDSSSSSITSEGELQQLASMYYELVAEAKDSMPATPERCKKWRSFLERHCKFHNLDTSRLLQEGGEEEQQQAEDDDEEEYEEEEVVQTISENASTQQAQPNSSSSAELTLTPATQAADGSEQQPPRRRRRRLPAATPLHQLTFDDMCRLEQLSPKRQLEILGLPYAVLNHTPVPPALLRAAVAAAAKREEEENAAVTVAAKHEKEDSHPNATIAATISNNNNGNVTTLADDNDDEEDETDEFNFDASTKKKSNTKLSNSSSAPATAPTQPHQHHHEEEAVPPLTAQQAMLRELLKADSSIRDFEQTIAVKSVFEEAEDDDDDGEGPKHKKTKKEEGTPTVSTTTTTTTLSQQQPPPTSSAAAAAALELLDDPTVDDGAVRPLSSPWETVRMPHYLVDTTRDLEDYIDFDNESRILRMQAALRNAANPEQWKRGAKLFQEYLRKRAAIDDPFLDDELLFQSSADGRVGGSSSSSLVPAKRRTKRRRETIHVHATVEDAVARALRGKGASTMNLSQLHVLVPGLQDEADVHEEAVSGGRRRSAGVAVGADGGVGAMLLGTQEGGSGGAAGDQLMLEDQFEEVADDWY